MDPSPRALKFCLLVLCCAASAASQDPSPASTPPATSAAPTEAQEQAAGAIQGTVLNGATGQPLRRAQVLLKSADSKTRAIYQTTDESGGFSFAKVAAGRYTITVQRDGYLPLSAGRIGSNKMPTVFTLQSGQTLSSFEFRLTAGGVVSGKIKFDDAEPAANVTVQLYRSLFERGRHGYAAAASARSDDRGEYRLHNLEPGSYYVAALYQAPPRPPAAEEEARKDALGHSVPDLSYAVTFFPEAQKISDAVPVKMAPGAEVAGIDIFLTLVHTVRIRGRIVSGTKGAPISNPGLALLWNDADNTASVSAPINFSFDKEQSFEIRGVTAGPYVLVASGVEGGVAVTGRVPINIADAEIANVDVAIGPESIWTGKIHLDNDDSALPAGLIVSLEPRRLTASPTRAAVSDKGEFAIPFVPEEPYDLYVLKGPADSYLKSILVGNSERLGQGLEAALGVTPPALEIFLSSKGGQVAGMAVTGDPRSGASGAEVALIPDPPTGRAQAYQTTHADENGKFSMRGVPPGKYVVVAWVESPPCEIYNPDDLPACRAQGSMVTMAEAEQQLVQPVAN